MKKNTILKIQSLSTSPWQTQDPFIFCAYHKDAYPKGNDKMGPDASLEGRNIGQDFANKEGWNMYHGETIPGFPYHPHRGFETISIAKRGMIDHTDSLGSAGRFGNGDVQWMTAGKGVQHSEMFPLLNKDQENPMEMFQIWLNLPKSSKLVEPHYKMLWSEDIPVLREKDTNGKSIEIDVIAGELNHLKALTPTPDSWAANLENEVAVWTIKLEAHAQWTLPASKQEVNRGLYFYEGESIQLDEEEISVNKAIYLKSNERITIQAGNKDSYLLMLQGKPINEPVAQYGPFVMNTQQEIQEAFAEYQRTQFGGWPWPNAEQVHDITKGRFALHADGREEIK